MLKRIVKKIKMNIVIVAVAITVIAGLVFLGFSIWEEYKTKLLQNQEEQLLIISKTLARYMELSIESYDDGLGYLADMEAKGYLSIDTAKQYIGSLNDFVSDIIFYNSNGEIVNSINNTVIKDESLLSTVYNDTLVYQLNGEDGDKYLGFKQILDTGTTICLLIDADKYYERLISDIQIGTNGYLMIKSSSGKIIMHPKDEQWGIEVIEGRQELYPNLDYESLEALIKEQQLGQEGIAEYYSYWWTDPSLPRVRKVSAYAPIDLGDEFWIVSAVTDYDDLYNPIFTGLMKILTIFVAIFIIFSILLIVIIKLLMEKQKDTSAINYLRQLNSTLEEMHRSEEEIRHQQRLQIVGTMTSGIVHEFNNFLTPILGYAEMLKATLPDNSEEYDNVNEILEAAQKAEDVIRQISSLSKRNVETVYKVIPAKKLIQRFLKMAKSVCPANVHTESHIELDEECILGNSTQINQVLLNIYVNAIQAINGQEGIIEIDCHCVRQNQLDERVKVSSVWNKFICIDIKDNGCGIDSTTLEHIFDPFFTTKKEAQGTGLGLTLAEQIVVSHKGAIYIDSQSGTGTIFHVVLPVAEDQIQSSHEEKTLEMENVFVIVGENMKVLDLLETSLKKLNITVFTCKTKLEVEIYMEEYDVDALFIDESVDNVGGVELCMALRNSYPQLLMFIMYGRISREIVEAKRNGLIDGYIEKPVSDVELVDAVRLGRQRKMGDETIF